MPRLLMFRGEKTLDELAARLFRSNQPQAQQHATDALLKTNPQLADLGRLPPGSLIVVPDLPDAISSSETLSTKSLAPSDCGRLVGAHAAAFAGALEAQSANAAEQANSTLKLLEDPSLTTAATQDNALGKRLAAIKDNTKVALKDMQAKRALLEQGIAQMQQDLAHFLKAFASPIEPPSALPSSPPSAPTSPLPQPPTHPPASPTAPPAAPRRGRQTKTGKTKKK
jgi:phage tail protein X